jgi:hypothetical protein
MTDSALQAALGLFAGEGGKLALPFAVEEVEIVNRCSLPCGQLYGTVKEVSPQQHTQAGY